MYLAMASRWGFTVRTLSKSPCQRHAKARTGSANAWCRGCYWQRARSESSFSAVFSLTAGSFAAFIGARNRHPADRLSAPRVEKLRDEKDLADVPAGFHQAVGLRGLDHRKLLVGERAKPPGRPEGPDFFLQRGGDRGLLLDGSRAQGRAGYRQMLALDQAEIGLDLAAAHQRDKAEPALMRQQIELARDVVAADHVEDRIHAAPVGEFLADLHEILGAVVDRDIGAIVEACAALLVGPSRRQGLGAERFGELDRGNPNAARPALHQEHLSRLEAH